MKRQNSSLVSSTSRRQNSPETIHAKSIGCMSGIIHFLSNYQIRRKRYLTFAGSNSHKQESDVTSSRSDTKCSATPVMLQGGNQKGGCKDPVGHRRFSCDALRSPTLPPDIRRSNSTKSPRSFSSTPPALVARLMGLEGTPIPPTSKTVPETEAEKRNKLLGALEKCDQDLKALKKIIEAVRSAESFRSLPDPGIFSFDSEDKDRTISGRTYWDINCSEQQPSPVSVLDEFSRSHSKHMCSTFSKRHPNGKLQPQQKQPQQQQQMKRPGDQEDHYFNHSVLDRINKSCESPTWSSKKAMVDSVNEACKDIAWGERREIGRIGLNLQDQICRDLIEEIVRDMGFSLFSDPHSLPFEACRRRLCF